MRNRTIGVSIITIFVLAASLLVASISTAQGAAETCQSTSHCQTSLSTGSAAQHTSTAASDQTPKPLASSKKSTNASVREQGRLVSNLIALRAAIESTTTTTAVPQPVVVQPQPTVPSATTTTITQPTVSIGDQVTDALRAAWQRVADCEEGGNWHFVGSVYSGIGFLNSTWAAYGGLQYAPNAGLATEDQQIMIGMKITGGWVPDQNGCASW